MSKERNRNGRKIILGGGIAGLLFAFYNPEYLLISDVLGGQFKTKFQTGPRFLHVDKNTNCLLGDLNRYVGIKKVKVGYFYDGELHDENTEENKKRYFEKTRGESSQPYSSVMSSNKKEFESYIVDLSEIIDDLVNSIKNETMIGKITKIDTDNKKVYVGKYEYEYDELVSTIPLNIFLFLSGKEELAKQYLSFPTTFILMKNNDDCPFVDFKDYDYVYVSEEKYPFHRITKTKEGFVYEYKGDINSLNINQKDKEVLKVGQLVQNDNNIKFENVSFLGRFAEWKHNILINDVLKKIYSKK